jgi:hypothetical protein
MAEDQDRADIKIDGNTATWEMKLDGNINGTYMGMFKFRCFLTPLQQISAGREERDLLGINIALAPEQERFLAFALCQLKYRVISSPPFWASANPNGAIQGDIADEEVIAQILDAAITAENMYKKALKKRRENAVEQFKKLAEQIIDEKKAEESDDDDDELEEDKE